MTVDHDFVFCVRIAAFFIRKGVFNNRNGTVHTRMAQL